MKLKRAYGKQFMSFENIDVKFDDINGLNLIEGWNYDDNSASGAGKTALMDLISFVPFGQSPRDLKVNEFINDSAPNGCIAGLEFETDNGSKLVIERSRKPEDLFYQIDGNKPVRGGNVRETQKMVEEMLKLDFNTFVNSVYFTQNAKMSFISANDTDKRDILTRILDLSSFDEAYKSADIKIKELDKQIELVKNEIEKTNSLRSMCDSDLAALKQKMQDFDKDNNTQIGSKNTQIGSIQTKVKDYKSMIEFLENKKFEIPPFDVQPPDMQIYDKSQAGLRSIKFEEISEDIQKPDNSDLDEKVVELTTKISVKSKIESKIKEIEKQRTEISFQLKANDKIMSDILNTGVGQCPKCRQDVSKEHLDQEVDELQGVQNKLSETLKSLDLGKFTDALDKINEFERELNKVEIERNKREKDYSAAVKALADRQKAQAAEKLQIEKDIAAIEQSRANALKEYAMAEKIYAEKIKQTELEKAENSSRIQAQYTSIETCEEQIKQIQKDINELKTRENPFISSIRKKVDDIAELDIALEHAMNRLKALNDEGEVLAILKASYKNVKYYIFESTIDELNIRIVKYLDHLFNEDVKVYYKYVSGKDSDKLKFETQIIKNGIEKSYESLSDGEKGRAKLATNFALSDIVALRKSSSFSLMLLDEVFNGLPEECRERVVSLLEMLKDEKECILIIDHFKAVGTLIENTIKVEKRNGVSRVVDE